MTETPTVVPAAPRPQIDELATALAAFQAEMPIVPKAHRATVKSDKGQYTYTYAGLADVSAAAMPLLSKHGLSFVTLPGNGVLQGMLLHSSGQSLSASLPITGGTPQQIGSSLTYMRRYLLGCLTGLVTDDDDDGQLAQQSAARKRTAPRIPPTTDTTPDGAMSAKTRGAMFALFGDLAIAEDDQLPGINQILGAAYTSRGDLTEADAKRVIEVLKRKKVDKVAELQAGAS